MTYDKFINILEQAYVDGKISHNEVRRLTRVAPQLCLVIPDDVETYEELETWTQEAVDRTNQAFTAMGVAFEDAANNMMAALRDALVPLEELYAQGG